MSTTRETVARLRAYVEGIESFYGDEHLDDAIDTPDGGPDNPLLRSDLRALLGLLDAPAAGDADALAADHRIIHGETQGHRAEIVCACGGQEIGMGMTPPTLGTLLARHIAKGDEHIAAREAAARDEALAPVLALLDRLGAAAGYGPIAEVVEHQRGLGVTGREAHLQEARVAVLEELIREAQSFRDDAASTDTALASAGEPASDDEGTLAELVLRHHDVLPCERHGTYKGRPLPCPLVEAARRPGDGAGAGEPADDTPMSGGELLARAVEDDSPCICGHSALRHLAAGGACPDCECTRNYAAAKSFGSSAGTPAADEGTRPLVLHGGGSRGTRWFEHEGVRYDVLYGGAPEWGYSVHTESGLLVADGYDPLAELRANVRDDLPAPRPGDGAGEPADDEGSV